MKLEFLSKMCNASFARSTIAAFASQLDITLDDVSDIKTAVSEAITNSIIHAYKESIGMIKITSKIILNTLEVCVEDEGCGIKNIALALENSFTTAKFEGRCGMGFSIMKEYMDFLNVESDEKSGTKVFMKKIIKHE
ncbi:MAG: anti-sigma F factor [Clostridiales bacterium]|jgi:stage II sporulation protein AB (anti-sigma F factor)|nr:anti-sigma F factor [Clostridiales bacterium]